MELLRTIVNSIKNINLSSVLDILVVAYIFYKSYTLIKETRAEQLLKGLIFIVILIPISEFFNLNMLNWILSNTITIGLLTFIIIFQPEIRRVLEHIGRSTFSDKHIFEDKKATENVIKEIADAVENLSNSMTGALIVIEQVTGLRETSNTGVKIDALISSALLENIFVVNTPLHDGAVIIRNDRIESAGCFLPLTSDNNLNKTLGTRHRAAIGISEASDAIVIIVSEETGNISLAVNGILTRNYTKKRLKNVLVKLIENRKIKKSKLGEQVVAWIRKIKSKK